MLEWVLDVPLVVDDRVGGGVFGHAVAAQVDAIVALDALHVEQPLAARVDLAVEDAVADRAEAVAAGVVWKRINKIN